MAISEEAKTTTTDVDAAGRAQGRAVARPRRRLRTERHEPVQRDPPAARLPRASAGGAGRRDEPARLRRVPVGRRLPHAPPDARRASRSPTRGPPRGRTPPTPLSTTARTTSSHAGSGSSSGTPSTFSSRTRACPGSCRSGGAARRRLGVSPRFATLLRHPAAVIDSKQRSYGHWQSDVSRTAGWLNQTLFTERATRESPRVFVRYEDLLDDWTRIVGHVGEKLDLAVDPRRARGRDRRHPRVRRQGPQPVEGQLGGLRHPDRAARAGRRRLGPRLPARRGGRRRYGRRRPGARGARAAYVSLYEDAEAIAQSSITAGPRKRATKGKTGGTLLRLADKMPRDYREKLPLSWRKAAYRAKHGRRKR